VSTWLEDGEGGIFERQNLRGSAHRRRRRRARPRRSRGGRRAPRTLATWCCSSKGPRGLRFFATSPKARAAVALGRAPAGEARRGRLRARRLAHQRQALRRGAAQAAQHHRLARRGRDRERAPLRGLAGHVPADDRGAREGHRQDGPLHRGPQRARRGLRDAARARSSACRSPRSRSCGRARSCTTSARSAACST
jgi:hypothetical protein